MKDRFRGIKEEIRSEVSDYDLFYDNEIAANRLGEIVLLTSGAFLILVFILTVSGVFPLQLETIIPPTIYGVSAIVIMAIISRKVGRRTWWMKYLIISCMIIVYAGLDVMLTHKAAILMVIPVVFSSRYYSKSLTDYTIIVSTIAFLISAYLGPGRGMIDLNIVTMPAGVTFTSTCGFLGEAVENLNPSLEMLRRNTLLYAYLPKWMMFFIVAIISRNIARTGRDMVINQHEKDQKAQAMRTELEVANRIQLSFLPSSFPAYPERKEFDIYASMHPAREVGGDFYDFFFIDKNRMALVMADVSGKGIPAALYMIGSKILTKTYVMNLQNPAKVLSRVNKIVCSQYRGEAFVTIWLGIFDVSSGKVIACNAGHEYPILMRKGCGFELIKDSHGLVVGGLGSSVYENYEFVLNEGDKLFLYTDGLPEACDSENHMFGFERTVAALNEFKDGPPEEILNGVALKMKEFAGGTEQFDDVTMMCIEKK